MLFEAAPEAEYEAFGASFRLGCPGVQPSAAARRDHNRVLQPSMPRRFVRDMPPPSNAGTVLD
ncbi:msl3091 [Mesorhizobium japonicum MAFF 303099]|uniref:Msl3091 protein n=1 Tax=Mesorhizobium japonicum (strain LMG 29417 / CECT 9101 / MAFF 303099) TaxID=266835 RepID=Q98H04_RHILO|nr:msl3091 [Mesorhizobium japonicum MAFF 303099]